MQKLGSLCLLFCVTLFIVSDESFVESSRASLRFAMPASVSATRRLLRFSPADGTAGSSSSSSSVLVRRSHQSPSLCDTCDPQSTGNGNNNTGIATSLH